ncbi:primosomal protein [archaeon]|nr:primosomal protein [archaeon]NCQ51441.1 primosomal protein [archaeon]NCT58733.1 primosomal protein [archaeon]
MSDLILEDVDFSLIESEVEELQEGMAKTKIFYLKGPFLQAEIQNGNKRIYPKSIIEREVEKYNKVISEKRSVGELLHPSNTDIDPSRISHLVTELKMDGNTAIGKAKILDKPAFPCGMIAKALVEEGIKIGISSRGTGTLKNGIVQNDYHMICQDLVWNPSGPNCFLDGIMESQKEWVIKNGILTEEEIDTVFKKADNIVIEHNVSTDEKAAAFLKLFNDTLNKIKNK